MARLSVSQSCLLGIFVVLQNTIKAARMRGLRRSGVMENVRLSCCLLTILREIALLGQPLTYTLGAMKPETVSASVITADDTAKQLALNKVSDHYGL